MLNAEFRMNKTAFKFDEIDPRAGACFCATECLNFTHVVLNKHLCTTCHIK